MSIITLQTNARTVKLPLILTNMFSYIVVHDSNNKLLVCQWTW